MVIPRLLTGESYRSGPVCVSVQRVFVPRAELADFAAETGAGAEALVVGDPTKEEIQCGALIRLAEVDRVKAWVGAAVEGGSG